ncbi:MAG: transcriptional repressor LexA, partial [Blautia hydrogenotrophica]
LQPENDTMEPIIVDSDQEFKILGKVFGVFRLFE